MSDKSESVLDALLRLSVFVMGRVAAFVKKRILFISAAVAWCVFWNCFIMDIVWYYYIIIPCSIAVLVLSLFLVSLPRFKFIPTILWAAPTALFFLFVTARLVSFPLTNTLTYYIGMDINTPNGLKTCKSMIEYSDYILPFWLNQFRTRHSKLQGEAVFCDLGNEKNVIAVLAFEKDLEGRRTLSMLPWLAAGYPVKHRDKWPPFVSERQELKGKLNPILITLPDINDPMSMKRVYPGKLAEVLGEGYSIQSMWLEMTKDEYESAETYEHFPWMDYTGDYRAAKVYYKAFKLLGFKPSNPFNINY